MAATPEMQSFAARLNTFQIPHQLSKRRASSQASKKKGGSGVEWPHERPSGEELARAGFFYCPVQDSHDNVKCFLCAVKLDGWEPDDDALKEHLAHYSTCQWAISLRAGESARAQDEHDPMSDERVAARKATFEIGAGWPHESKRGWKCKTAKMIEAGWCFDPSPSGEEEDGDGVTCFYCNLSLDGWEPKDDPMVEHKRRSPDCTFFALVEKFGSAEPKKGKGKGKKGAGRTSTASKASRLSTQSARSTFSEVPSFADVGEVPDVAAGVDDSITSVATNASRATATGASKGKKKGGRPKAAAKSTKGRKRAGTVDSQADAEPLYPDLSMQVPSQKEEIVVSPPPAPVDEPASMPTKKTRKGGRQSKQQADSSVVEISSLDVAPPKKATRSRKAKAQPEPEPEPELDADDSEVSAQLQEELERSMSMGVGDNAELDDVTPQPEPARLKRGVKRTSDGFRKKQEDSDSSAVIVEFPVPPKAAAATKGKRGRKPSKQVTQESDPNVSSQILPETQEDVPMSEPEPEPVKPAKARKAAAVKGKGKGKKASTTRSSRSSKATATSEPDRPLDEAEDLERDEREIEAELQRIAAEQAAEQPVQVEQERTAEFEPSPSHVQKHVNEIRQLEEELQAEVQTIGDPGMNMANYVASVAASPPQTFVLSDKENTAPSPSGSDKENQPSSIIQPSAKQTRPMPSPTKTTRIPLAPSTPDKLRSPTKLILSPSKQQLSHLTSTIPWEPVDLDTVLLTSPQPTPGTLGLKLASAAGALTSPEKGLTVEEWVRLRAQTAEEQLRGRCEEMVGVFEREGNRAVGALGGLQVVS